MTRQVIAGKPDMIWFRLNCDLRPRWRIGLTIPISGEVLLIYCRQARKEITVYGLKVGALENASYEGWLLWSLIPEMARRLINEQDVTLLRTREERPAMSVTRISNDRLRRDVALCYREGNFGIISEKIRDSFDPDYRISDKFGTFQANEMISRDVRAGNIIEIALNRISPAPKDPSGSDWMACLIREWGKHSGLSRNHVTWSPELPEYHSDIEMNDLSNSGEARSGEARSGKSQSGNNPGDGFCP